MGKVHGKYSEKENSQAESVTGLKLQISCLEKQIETLRKVEESLRESEENFRDIFETVQEGLAYATLAGNVISINRNLEKMVGLPRGELVGKNIITVAKDFLNLDNVKKIMPWMQEILAGRMFRPFQFEFRDKILEITPSINKKTRRLTATFRDITQSYKIQDELRVSETRLKRAELATRSGNWELHLDTGTMYGSDGAMKLYGVHESPMDFSIVKNIPLPEFRPMMDKALDNLIKLGKPYNIEFRIKKVDTGEIIDIHSICEFDKKNQILFGSIQDITDQKKAENIIMRNNRDLANFLEITMILLETVDRKQVFLRIMEGALKLTSLDSAALYYLEGENLFLEATIPSLPEDLPSEFRKAILSNHIHIQKAVATNTPLIVPDIRAEKLSLEEQMIVDTKNLCSAIYIPLIANRKVMGVLILGSVGRAYNFTDREIRLSRTLSNIASLTLENSLLFDNLTVAKEKAEESDRLKTAFLHNISHEIRTPLNAIIGFSGFLDQPDLTPEDRKEYIEIIFQSNNQLLSIINDILSISHIEAKQVELRLAAVDLNRIIKRVHSQFFKQAEQKNIDFRIKTGAENDLAVVETDEGKLIQVLSNLISNALKFTNEGHIEFGYERKDDHFEFYVEDTGIGVSDFEKTRIFERFYQVSRNSARIYGGTGLGLSISKGYVELMGGKMWLESSLDKGSVFYFTIPGNKTGSVCAKEEPVALEKRQGSGKAATILVAEDEESNFALIAAMLKQRDYNIIRARNGQEAIDIFKADAGINLILMDIKMPVMDGFEATTEILRLNPGVPVVAQTAYVHPSDRELAEEIGFCDYLSKPFDKDQLIGIVEKYIR